MTKIKELMENKILRIIVKVTKILVVIILLTFVFVIYLQRFSNNRVSFFNYRMFTVVSRSMEPKYTIGDVLFSKEVKPSSINVGDDISYIGTKGDVKNKIVTHRVTKVIEEDGKYSFRAKGLSNIIEDPIIYEDQLYGVVVYKSVILSFIYKIVATEVGFYLCIIIPLVLIIGYEIFVTMMEKEEKRRIKK